MPQIMKAEVELLGSAAAATGLNVRRYQLPCRMGLPLASGNSSALGWAGVASA